ncbi:Trk system potassium transporter TrkA [candidate division KSB1 bacterium]|nr:Trk system potassium transporter TrkA [candidate division KSB1 bacterium]NIR72633.1 Trk system potassium transporter TrkA [candidate division KSB1 bacterium]NIS27344.1 Trk system potassium transporter TrkA [candidate division KSB1 bacterium]NIT73557.1 Trk system potassium transporter TrkA [candidate division KSB1 bacterium]NIU25405.1 Trk system potassium transporter TrkA [candidate division KSB1 bacterium]
MRIIIIGAGEVGFHLAQIFSKENHQVVIIEPDSEKIKRAEAALDILAIEGSGSSVGTLVEAGIKTAELVIAVSAIDEVNIIACMLADKFGVARKIARVRNPEYTNPDAVLTPQQLGINLMINPELETAQEIVWLIRHAAATDVIEFANGAIQLVGLRLDSKAKILSKKLRDISDTIPDLTFRTVAISRNNNTIIPSGEDYFHKGDQIFVVSKTDSVPELLDICGKTDVRMEKIMILGGGKVGRLVAKELEQDKSLDIRLIESNRWKSQFVADQLKRTLVIQGDGTDVDLLASEGLIDMDAFVAVTDDEESNLITSLLAKHLGVRRTITMVKQANYIPLMSSIGLDAAVDKRIITANAIARFIHRGEVVSVATFRGIDAEAIELVAQERSRIVKKPLKDLKFPKGAIIGAVMRNGNVFVPVGDSLIEPKDKVVVFALPKAVANVENMFE